MEFADRLMPQQLDHGAATMLKRTLAALGLKTRLGRKVTAIEHDHVTLDDGERLEADLVVIAAGVRPNTTLAANAGIDCGRGILVDDQLRTSVPDVFAVGECAEHRGTVYGLWAPLAEQARTAGAVIAGDPAAFHGATPATTLKVAGVDVFAGGDTLATDEILSSDTRSGRYRKLTLDGDRLTGAMLVGDVSDARQLSELLRTRGSVPEALLQGGAVRPVSSGDPDELVCSCNAVTRGELIKAIRRGGLTTVAQVGNATRAGTGCGSCTADLAALLSSSSAGNTDETVTKPLGASMAV